MPPLPVAKPPAKKNLFNEEDDEDEMSFKPKQMQPPQASIRPPPAAPQQKPKNLFNDDDEDEEESFNFNKKKPIAPPAPVV